MMQFPWTKRMNVAKDQTTRAENEYRWAVAQRTTVSRIVERVTTKGELENHIIQKFITVTRGRST